MKASSIIVSGKHFLQIRVEAEYGYIVNKSLNGSSGIRSDSGEPIEMFCIFRENSSIFLCNYRGCCKHIASAGIISESLIIREKLFVGSGGKRLDGRKTLQYILIVSGNSIHLRLLQQYLRKPDSIREIFV